KILVIKTKIALEDTSPLGLKADDPSFVLSILEKMRRWDVIEILQDGSVFGFMDLSGALKCNSPHTTVVAAIFDCLDDLRERDFSFAFHDNVDVRVIAQNGGREWADLGAPDHDFNVGLDFLNSP